MPTEPRRGLGLGRRPPEGFSPLGLRPGQMRPPGVVDAEESDREGFRPLDLFRGFAEGIGPQTVGMLGAYLEASGLKLDRTGKQVTDTGIEEVNLGGTRARRLQELGRALQEWSEGGGFNLVDSPISWDEAEGASETASALLGLIGSAFGQIVPVLATGAAGARVATSVGGGALAGTAGGTAAGFTAGYVMNYGDTFALIRDELGGGKENARKAADYAEAFAPVISAIDTLGLGLAVGQAGLLRKAKEHAVKSMLAAKVADKLTDQQAMALARQAFAKAGVTKKMLQDANKGGARAALSGTGQAAAGGAFAEGGTEALQRLVQGVAAEQAGAEVDWGRTFLEAGLEGFAGSAVGAGLSGAGRFASNRQAMDAFRNLPEEEQQAHLDELGDMESLQTLPRKDRRDWLKRIANVGRKENQRRLTHGAVGSALGEGFERGTRLTVTDFDEDQNPTESEWEIVGGAETFDEDGQERATDLVLREVMPDAPEDYEPRTVTHPFPLEINWKRSETQPASSDELEIEAFKGAVQNALSQLEQGRDELLSEVLSESGYENLDAVAASKELRAPFLKVLRERVKAAKTTDGDEAKRKEEIRKRVKESVETVEALTAGDKEFEGSSVPRDAKAIQFYYPTEEELLAEGADVATLLDEGAANARYRIWADRQSEVLQAKGVSMESADELLNKADSRTVKQIVANKRLTNQQIDSGRAWLQRAVEGVNKWKADDAVAAQQLGLPKREGQGRLLAGADIWVDGKHWVVDGLAKPFTVDRDGKLTGGALKLSMGKEETKLTLPTDKVIHWKDPNAPGGTNRNNKIGLKREKSIKSLAKILKTDLWFKGFRLDGQFMDRPLAAINHLFPTFEELVAADAKGEDIDERLAQASRYAQSEFFLQQLRQGLASMGLSGNNVDKIHDRIQTIRPEGNTAVTQSHLELLESAGWAAIGEVNKWKTNDSQKAKALGLPPLKRAKKKWSGQPIWVDGVEGTVGQFRRLSGDRRSRSLDFRNHVDSKGGWRPNVHYVAHRQEDHVRGPEHRRRHRRRRNGQHRPRRPLPRHSRPHQKG